MSAKKKNTAKKTPAKSAEPKKRNASAAYTPGEKITKCRVCGSQDSRVIRVERRPNPDRCIRRRQCEACRLNGHVLTWITVDLETWKAETVTDPKPAPPAPILKKGDNAIAPPETEGAEIEAGNGDC